MTGETKSDVSGWTTDTLKAFVAEVEQRLEERIAATLTLTEAVRAGDQAAITKAEAAAEAARLALRHEAESWKADHNNLIEQLTAQGQAHSESLVRMVETLASKDALRVLERSVDMKVERVEKFQNRMAGGMLVLAAIGVTNLVKVWGG